jgi:histone-binding protein RBBP4
MSVDKKYSPWKSLILVLCDWLANYNLAWPSQSCRWGSILHHATPKSHHCLYLSEQTKVIVPNTLIIATCKVLKPRVAATEHIAQFNEEAGYLFVKKQKTTLHPDKVNKIKELSSNTNIVATLGLSVGWQLY